MAGLAPPGTIAAGTNWTSGLISAQGESRISVGVTLSTAGTLSVTRYIDNFGSVPLSPVTTVLSAGTAAALGISDNNPFQLFQFEINNPGTAVGTVSNFAYIIRP